MRLTEKEALELKEIYHAVSRASDRLEEIRPAGGFEKAIDTSIPGTGPLVIKAMDATTPLSNGSTLESLAAEIRECKSKINEIINMIGRPV